MEIHTVIDSLNIDTYDRPASTELARYTDETLNSEQITIPNKQRSESPSPKHKDKHRVVLTGKEDRIYFSYDEYGNPYPNNFDVTISHNEVIVCSYHLNGELLRKKSIRITNEKYKGIVQSINTLGLYQVAETKNFNLCGGGARIRLVAVNDGLQILDTYFHGNVYVYNDPLLRSGTLSGDIAGLLKFIQSIIHDCEKMSASKFRVKHRRYLFTIYGLRIIFSIGRVKYKLALMIIIGGVICLIISIIVHSLT